ncbi:MAG: lysophospholipid acyltransferase family protein [Bacteroidetes bacterium]|nr:lysophospholipid acyltransferase family protein [Bacteroidota bacterium]MDA1121094.1 lysophospholipid acyltransferase family protein [Bacteroidota bacterium]
MKEYREPLDKKLQYVFCANHFSYIDIPVMSTIPLAVVFVGKISMSKIPLFGYLYRNLHVLVDRQSNKSRYEAMKKSLEVFDRGFSLAIFPEGGIISKNPPEMAAFKRGAFKVAIERKIPIVPVTLPYNYLFFPDDGKMLLSYRSLKIIFHKKIETSNYTESEINDLNKKVFDIIAGELVKE